MFSISVEVEVEIDGSQEHVLKPLNFASNSTCLFPENESITPKTYMSIRNQSFVSVKFGRYWLLVNSSVGQSICSELENN
jgi:hypothetical protein